MTHSLKRTFDDIYQEFQMPFFAVLGNHDVKGNVLPQVIYSLKNPQWKMPNYFYKFETGLVSFSAINTSCNFWSWWQLSKMTPKHPKGWSILIGHHPIYSTGVHGDNELQKYLDLGLVFEKTF